MKNKNIVGLDIGNINSKITIGDFNAVFSSRIFECKTEGDKLSSDEIVTINDKELIIGTSGEYENNRDKYTKDNYIYLLQYAIAKYSPEKNVYLSVGLPISHYTDHDVKTLRNKILNNRSFSVKINGSLRECYIEDVCIIPESYGIFNTLIHNDLINMNNNSLIIDVGGGTTDISYINTKGKYQHDLSGSIDYGLLNFYRSVSDSVYTHCNKFRINIEDSKEFSRGNISYIGVDRNLLKECESNFYTKIINEIKGKYPMIENSNLIVVGGGCEVLGDYFKNSYPQAIKINNIYMNSKVFYNVGRLKFEK